MGDDGTEQDKRNQKADKTRSMGGDVPGVSQERKDDQRVVRGKRNSYSAKIPPISAEAEIASFLFRRRSSAIFLSEL